MKNGAIIHGAIAKYTLQQSPRHEATAVTTLVLKESINQEQLKPDLG
jgi:hypothetical protein